MTIEAIITAIGSTATLIGIFLIWYQVKSARKDSITGSLISGINDHWQVIEERKMKLRTGDEVVYYPTLNSILNDLLLNKYRGNLTSLSKDFLFDCEKYSLNNKKEVFLMIEREYAYQDVTFNLYEEEYLTGKLLKLVDVKIWNYWEYYIKEHFSTHVKQNHWLLRKKVGVTYPPFAMFIEQNYINKKSM